MDTDRLLRHLAWLARIEVSPEEERVLARRLEKARRVIDRVLEAPVDEVEPLYHAAGVEGPLREDEPRPSMDREAMLANAAKTENGYVVAPRTVEE